MPHRGLADRPMLKAVIAYGGCSRGIDVFVFLWKDILQD